MSAYSKSERKAFKILDKEEEVPTQEREKAGATAARYFELSLRYALLGSHPKLLVVMGPVGSGKSTIARHLAQKLNIERFSSDRIRKKMAGLPLHKRPPKEKRDELYSREMSDKTYQTLLDKAIEYLEGGQSVILDATYSKRSAREKLLKTIEVPLLFIETEAPDTIIKKRLEARGSKNKVVSDARREDFEDLSNTFEEPREIAEEHLVKISTDCSVSKSQEQLYKKLADINIQRGEGAIT